MNNNSNVNNTPLESDMPQGIFQQGTVLEKDFKHQPYNKMLNHMMTRAQNSPNYNIKDPTTFGVVHSVHKLVTEQPSKDQVLPRKDTYTKFYENGEWNLEVYNQWLVSMNPGFLTIDETFIRALINGHHSFYIPVNPQEVLLDEWLDNRTDPAFLTWCGSVYGFAKRYYDLLKPTDRLRRRDLRELRKLTTIEQINTDPTKIQVPVIYPSSYYRTHYPVRFDVSKSFDKVTKQPIYFLPKQGVYTCYPELVIMRLELLRVNPFLEGKFQPFRQLNIGQVNLTYLDTIDSFAMLQTLNRDSDNVLIRSLVDAYEQNKNKGSYVAMLLEEFARKHFKTINKLPRSAREITKERVFNNITKAVGLLNQAMGVPSLRKKNCAEVSTLLYDTKAALRLSCDIGHLKVDKAHQMHLDLNLIASMLTKFIKTVNKT